MNHVYQLVWSDARGQYIAASEKLKARSRKGGSVGPVVMGALLTGLLGSMNASALDAGALPSGATVTAGVASLAQHGNVLDVNQTSQRAAIN